MGGIRASMQGGTCLPSRAHPAVFQPCPPGHLPAGPPAAGLRVHSHAAHHNQIHSELVIQRQRLPVLDNSGCVSRGREVLSREHCLGG